MPGVEEDMLTPRDCTASDLLFDSSDRSYAREYRFTVSGAGEMTADLSSEDFDSLLALMDGEYRVLAVNDDWGGLRDSHVERYLEPGRYILLVCTRPGNSGRYRVQTQFKPD